MDPIIVGEVLGAFGVKGWVKVRTYTQQPKNLMDYQFWFVKKTRLLAES